MKTWLGQLLTYRQLVVGLVIMLAVVLLGLLGPLVVDVNGAKVGSDIPDLTPSLEHPLGTDTVGRDLLRATTAVTSIHFSVARRTSS